MKHKLVLLFIITFISLGFTAHAGSPVDDPVDRELKGLWISMISRLSAGDIDGALKYVTYGSRGKYKEELTRAGDRLKEFSAEMEKIEPVYIRGNEAKYRLKINRTDGEITHYIWFRKDMMGRWKIEKF